MVSKSHETNSKMHETQKVKFRNVQLGNSSQVKKGNQKTKCTRQKSNNPEWIKGQREANHSGKRN